MSCLHFSAKVDALGRFPSPHQTSVSGRFVFHWPEETGCSSSWRFSFFPIFLSMGSNWKVVIGKIPFYLGDRQGFFAHHRVSVLKDFAHCRLWEVIL